MPTLPNRVVVLHIGGLSWDQVAAVPTGRELCAHGAQVSSLLPVPITGRRTQTTQLITGQNPGRTGDFDVLALRDYGVVPSPEVPQAGLRHAIAVAGRSLETTDTTLAQVPDSLHSLGASTQFVLINAANGDDASALDHALAAAREWAGAEGACLVLSAFRPAEVTAYVNLNDGLCEVGAMELETGGSLPAIVWTETLAFHMGNGQVWINLEGRSPSGIVAAGSEADRVAQALSTSLFTKLRDPQTGEPVIERVYRRDELYAGEALFRAPDLIAVLRPGYAHSARSSALACEHAWLQRAAHAPHGVEGLHPTVVAGLAIAVGSPFEPGLRIADASLLGIAPTILHVLGIPSPATMQGKLITGMLAPAFREAFPERHANEDNGLSADDEADITARLQSLGYLG